MGQPWSYDNIGEAIYFTFLSGGENVLSQRKRMVCLQNKRGKYAKHTKTTDTPNNSMKFFQSITVICIIKFSYIKTFQKFYQLLVIPLKLGSIYF